jgi:hypothetical protein
MIGPMDKDPSNLGVDLYIVQLSEEGVIRATWPQIHSHCHLLSSKWLDAAADEGPQEVCACQLPCSNCWTTSRRVVAYECIAEPHHTPT